MGSPSGGRAGPGRTDDAMTGQAIRSSRRRGVGFGSSGFKVEVGSLEFEVEGFRVQGWEFRVSGLRVGLSVCRSDM